MQMLDRTDLGEEQKQAILNRHKLSVLRRRRDVVHREAQALNQTSGTTDAVMLRCPREARASKHGSTAPPRPFEARRYAPSTSG